MASKKKQKATERNAYGITVLKAADARIRKLKKEHEPNIHGNKIWNSSWCIMDFLQQQGMPKGSKVLEAGCGWGPTGIYCAKNYAAKVTGLDADPAVFPYLDLHAKINDVTIKNWQGTFEQVKKKDLKGTCLVLGADICFWDEMIEPIYKLVKRSIDAGVDQIIIADPGRPPFHKMCDKVVDKIGGEVKEWNVDDEVKASAYLLIVGTLL
ncbi:MAG: class I SAM-dependent methyltransferase [Candidatus Latescibacterota bacterium]|jgi:predicted nicotinamide N-methyase